ncbi:polysaccharide deacetylase family protein [Deinococcus sp. NW-56]|uniref:polysaccharide deacetylase family protein n=1 Tax=Deinococcus sp. NW-56 TaxID=2080419 RepID=UPI000CF3DDB3|nr:polysaccharide deacetylase family protein [Deinococcus sp. NW-56]
MRLLALLLALVCVCCLPRAEAGHLPLVYHQVGGGGGVTLGLDVATLRRRVETLRAAGYLFVTSSEALRFPASARTASLRFDDGFESVYTLAFPVLRDLGVAGTVYPIWERVGQPGYLTAAQLEELRGAGWEVGSHTRTHAALVDLTPPSLTRELAWPAGAAPAGGCLAYPFYLQDARVRRHARAGYACAVAGTFGVSGEAHALPGPLASPWDDWLLPWRAPLGADLRVPALLAGAGLGALGSQDAPVAVPPLWNPAAHELLGSGAFSLSWEGGVRDTRFLWRQGGWVLGLNLLRGGASYSGGTLAYHVGGPLTVAGGYGSAGPLGAVALALGGYGEVWARALPGSLTLGAEVLPLDYLRVRAEYDVVTRLGRAEGSYALPLRPGEGRPLRATLGYDGTPYAGVALRVGAHTAALTTRLDRPAFGVRVQAVW